VAPREATRAVPDERSLIVPGERALIDAIRREAAAGWTAGSSGKRALRLGIGDDCALLRPRPRHEICITTDFTLENRHFRRTWHPPESVGHRCLARGLSDLAAMGAEPLAVFLSLAIPAHLPAAWVNRFLRGFLTLARKYRVPLAGGDTAESPRIAKARDGFIAADIVAVGEVPQGRAVLRSGARPGDAIYLTGALGGAAAELRALEKNPRRFHAVTHASAQHPHLYPEPRLAAGRRLRDLAHAMIDISDGLSTDLDHLCEESGLRAVIDQAALPIHSLTLAFANPLDLALHGGDDYELLFTARAGTPIPRRIKGIPIHRIGTMQKPHRGRPCMLLQKPDGTQIPLKPGGWQHFA